MNNPSLSLISQSSGFELEELYLGADQFNGNLDAGSEDLEDEEEVHDDNEEDDHHEVESNIEVDGDNDNNMQPSLLQKEKTSPQFEWGSSWKS